nr:hypothetical protein [Escherichia coli]
MQKTHHRTKHQKREKREPTAQQAITHPIPRPSRKSTRQKNPQPKKITTENNTKPPEHNGGGKQKTSLKKSKNTHAAEKK